MGMLSLVTWGLPVVLVAAELPLPEVADDETVSPLDEVVSLVEMPIFVDTRASLANTEVDNGVSVITNTDNCQYGHIKTVTKTNPVTFEMLDFWTITSNLSYLADP